MKFSCSLVVLTAALISVSSAYRILAVFPMNTKNHFVVFESVIKSLAKRGHQVDVVSHFPRKNPIENYNDIINLQGLMSSLVNNLTIGNTNFDIVNLIGDTYGNRICDFMGNEKIQKLVKNPPMDQPYDLVLTQAYGAHCYFGLGYVFNVSVVAVTSPPEFPWLSSFIGNIENLAVHPHSLHIVKAKKMNFWERLNNAYTYYLNVCTFNKVTEKYQTEAMRKYLGSDLPSVRDAEKNVALLLVNTHPVINGVKPITPGLVQIGGLHIEQNQETLPLELKQWMDESTSGVVYFTLGSMVLIETLPKEQLLGIYAAFKKISPVRVLMKIADNSKLPPGLPENVRTMPWMPQPPVLAHKNTKVYITHGGLASTQEAVYFGIPTIGIPLFGDQFSNVESLVAKGMSIRIDLDKISENSLGSALRQILNNSQYKKNAVLYSRLFRDNPTSQSEKATFWIEYVIRNGGDSLKSPALQFSWFQLLLLDVFVFLTTIFISILFFVTLCVKLLLKKSLKYSVNRYRIIIESKKFQ